MRRTLTLARKEFIAMFRTPVAYLVIALFLTVASLWFFGVHQFLGRNVASLRAYFAVVPLLFVVLLPALTMRSWAEERSSGTAELLLTLPFSELQLVAGKFLGGFALVCVMLIPTLLVPLSVAPLGRFDPGPIIGQYLGTVLLAAAGLAVGQCASAVSRNQISAFLSAAALLMVLTAFHVVNAVVPLPPTVAATVNQISFLYHFSGFERGVIDSRAVIYFLVVVGASLGWTTHVLAMRRWR
ncbi:MAG: ABC transporter permease [Spirochaetaceae bacterium]|nr:MAG: ABC transporter permease [Spirochaetaceae bacterium]